MEPSRKSDRRRAAQRRIAARRRRTALRMLCGLLILILIILVAGIVILSRPDPLVSELTVEAGVSPKPEQFLEDPEKYEDKPVSFVTDLSKIDLTAPGEHELELSVDGKTYTTLLRIEDRTAPKGDPVDTVTEVGVMPKPEDLVTNIQDVGTVTVSYRTEPDVSQGGDVTADVLLTDAAGNTSVIRVNITVIADEISPVIEGAVDLEFYVGDPITYKSGITVTDDKTENPKLVVDNSQVDAEKAGTYPVTYIATDNAGNSTSVTVNLTLVDKPEGYVEPDVVYALAQDVLDQITDDSMTRMEVAFAIYNWTKSNIEYVGSSDKTSWTAGAYQAFKERSGDCFNYFAAAKAMYEVAGIENVDVVKSDTSHSSHYWSLINLGDGWYHVDCTPRRKVGYFFMNTDAELEAYSVNNKNSHIFDGSLYPERATESVQDLVDYENGQVFG